MTYSTTLTASQTFTIADAKYLASRIASDLTQLRLYYGQLTEQKVQDLTVEAAILLKAGLLDNVKYGYQKEGKWVFAISYSVNYLGQLEVVNDSPGGIDATANVTGASWSSWLTRRNNPNLSAQELREIEQLLPIQRGSGTEPSTTNGAWSTDKTYYRNGSAISRGQFRSY
jgi:hypothetical protein